MSNNMYSFSARLNTIFFFALMCLASIGGLAAVSNYIPAVNPPDVLKNLVFDVTDVSINKFLHNHRALRRGVRKSKLEFADLTFSADIDLSDEFHWNTKQLFVWLTADYVGKGNSHVVHRSSLWDQLVLSPSQAVFELDGKVPEYMLIDPDLDLRDNKVNFTLNWDIHPWIGLIERKHSQNPKRVIMPVRYSQ